MANTKTKTKTVTKTVPAPKTKSSQSPPLGGKKSTPDEILISASTKKAAAPKWVAIGAVC